ncbi:MAG: hypothetical protein SGJ20_13565 [Planctomycetota bacterium]|nr:hypothetical protein [Planctomycetota bacterium]
MQKQIANVYTMMLILSFLAITIGCIFLYMEMSSYEGLSVPPNLKASSVPQTGGPGPADEPIDEPVAEPPA